MGFFNSYYNPGPGVEKNEKKKKGFFAFFEVFGVKFFKLIKANVLFFAASLIYLFFAIFVLAPFVSQAFGLEVMLNNFEDSDLVKTVIYTIIACVLLNYFGSGPVSAGYAFVTRCFSRREHTWILSDGWAKFKENFVNGMLLLITDSVVIFLLMNAISIYSFMVAQGKPFFMYLKYFSVMIFFVYMMAHIFAYQIMVTYECKFRDIIKNSIIMAMAKLPICVLLMVFTGAILFFLSYLGFFTAVVYAVIGLSFARFPLEFYASRVIDKNIIMVKKKTAVREMENERAEDE